MVSGSTTTARLLAGTNKYNDDAMFGNDASNNIR